MENFVMRYEVNTVPVDALEALAAGWTNRSTKCLRASVKALNAEDSTRAHYEDARSQAYILCADELRQLIKP